MNSLCEHAKSFQSCPSLCDPMEPIRLLCPWDSPGKNTGVGCHFLQGISPAQGSNPSLLCLLHWQEDSLPLHHLEAPKSAKIDVNMLVPEPHLDLVRSESLVMGLWEVILLTFAQIIF